MGYDQEYRQKLASAEAAAALVQPGDWVDYGFGLGQPDLFDRALAARRAELRDVRIRAALTLRPRAVIECDPHGEHFLWFSWHFSGLDRAWHDAGRCNYVPMNFGEGPDYYRRFIERVDVACLKTCPMDEHGYFNFGAAVSYHKALCERARLVVVEPSAAIVRRSSGYRTPWARPIRTAADFSRPSRTNIRRCRRSTATTRRSY